MLVNAAAIPPHMASAAEMDYQGQWVPTLVGEVDIVFLATQAAGPLIRANTISPGLVVTAATESAGGTQGAIRANLLARIPMKRLGSPEDIAWCAVFLASDESSWITGSNFPVDGGVLSA